MERGLNGRPRSFFLLTDMVALHRDGSHFEMEQLLRLIIRRALDARTLNKLCFTVILWLTLFPAPLQAQQERACEPNTTFARVGSLLQRREDQAAKRLLRALEPCTHLSPVQQFNIGWLYGKAHDPSDAFRVFESVKSDVPDRLTHAYAVALAFFELDHYQAAVDTLTTLRSAGNFDAKCADLLAVSYSKLDRYQDAYAVLAENIRQNPSDPYGYLNLITLFVDTSEMNKAAVVANNAVAAFPQSGEVLCMRGSIELFQGHSDDAYRDFAAAAELATQAPDPPFFMALVDYRQRKYDAAEQVLRNAIASGIVDSDLHYLLAECLLRHGPPNTADALLELNRAIRLNPNSVSARVLRGSTLLEVGRPQDALADLKIARNLDPIVQRDTRNTTYLLGRAYMAMGKREEARALFAQLGQQFSSNTDTLDQLSQQKLKAALHP